MTSLTVVSSSAGGYGRPADATGCLKVICISAKGLREGKALPDDWNSSEWTGLWE